MDRPAEGAGWNCYFALFGTLEGRRIGAGVVLLTDRSDIASYFVFVDRGVAIFVSEPIHDRFSWNLKRVSVDRIIAGYFGDFIQRIHFFG